MEDDSPPPDPIVQPKLTCASILNNILRKAYREPNKHERWFITNPKLAPSGAKLEADHFFEIQHIVGLLFNPVDGPLAETNTIPNKTFVYDVKLAEFVELAVHVSDGRNLFKISQEKNAKKKGISYEKYKPGNRDKLVEEYLNSTAKTQTGEEEVVWKILRELFASMAMWPANEKPLVRYIGRKVCTDMGWQWFGP